MVGGAAHVLGRGEHVTPLPVYLPWYFLVVLPGVHVSTQEAYRSLRSSLNLPATGAWQQPSTQPAATVLQALSNSNVLQNLHNDFESYAFKTYPQLELLCQTLQARGALYAGMSGSGSTIFGIFRSAAEAQDAQIDLDVPSYVCRQRE